MISKLIHCQAGNDNYGRLASYITDAGHSMPAIACRPQHAGHQTEKSIDQAQALLKARIRNL